MGVVITKVTETVRVLTVTRTVNARKHVQYPLVTRILAPCRADNHPYPTIPLNSSYYSGVSGMVEEGRLIAQHGANIQVNSPNGRFSPKLKVEKLTRTYAVNRRIFTSFQVICPT
jgi:hypothetical protein